MPRPRTATNILEARGAFKANPQRKRDKEPKVRAPFPSDPPACLTDDECECWREIVSIAPDGVLTGADTVAVEITARLLAEMRATGRDFPMTRLGHLRQMLARLGLDPSGRASLEVDKQEPPGEFDDV